MGNREFEYCLQSGRQKFPEQKKAVAKTSSKSNEIIQHLCDQLFKIRILEENTCDMFSMIKEVESTWIQQADQQEEMIKKINKFDQENSLNFLIKL